MKNTKFINKLLIILLFVWGIEVVYLIDQNSAKPEKIKTRETQNRDNLSLEYKKKIRDLDQEYEKKKYLATGETVFDRIYNSQDQSIINLIKRISREALPKDWSYDVKVEEFTHFILLIYVPHNIQQVSPREVASYLTPILKYCNWLISDVAVFDRTHKSYLFFNEPMLAKIEKNEKLSKRTLHQAKKYGESFTRFNSTTIACEKYESHLYLPLEVLGPKGVEICLALLDTGASITTLSKNHILKTGADNLQNVPQRTFNTANGRMSCPIVKREINVGGLRKKIEIAVNQKDEVNLLGMNFFDGMDYIVDFKKSAIYIWEKP